MAQKVQCPNCGGYRTESSSNYVDPTTGKRTAGSALGCFLSALAGVATFFIVLFASLATPGIHSKYLDSSTLLAAFFASLAVVVAILIISAIRIHRQTNNAILVYHSECELCGYSWKWDEGKPRTASQVRPDLIRKGAKKIEDDAAAASAAWNYQQQRDKKKR